MKKINKSKIVQTLSLFLLGILLTSAIVAVFDGEKYWAVSFICGFIGKSIYLITASDKKSRNGGAL